MKKIFFALFAVLAMVSCSNEEVIEVNREQIAFGEVFVDNATRADYSDGQDLTQFNVYGIVKGTAGIVNIFAGIPVTGTVGSNIVDGVETHVWSYAEQYTQYWIPGADYDFAAVVDADGVGTSTSVATIGMPTTLTSTADANGVRKDLLYAEGHVEDATANQGPVNFTFNHLLSKVHFTVTSNAQGDYYHTVTGISVSNFKSGTFTLDNVITPAIIDGGTWSASTADDNKKDVPFAEIANVTAATGGKSNADMLLVPNADAFNVTFTVDLYKGTTKLGTETKTIAVNNDLVKGHAYNFTIACSVGNPIKFSVTDDPTWTDGGNVTVQ
ncbi:MAG: fimbrillin family protein [Alistipes sp.]|nr:fimbrillin family protein [Alistipes sp.]